MTNINETHKVSFDFVREYPHDTALVSCFCNGVLTAAICRLTTNEDHSVTVQPLFVAVDDSMNITDHDGIQPTELGLDDKEVPVT